MFTISDRIRLELLLIRRSTRSVATIMTYLILLSASIIIYAYFASKHISSLGSTYDGFNYIAFSGFLVGFFQSPFTLLFPIVPVFCFCGIYDSIYSSGVTKIEYTYNDSSSIFMIREGIAFGLTIVLEVISILMVYICYLFFRYNCLEGSINIVAFSSTSVYGFHSILKYCFVITLYSLFVYNVYYLFQLVFKNSIYYLALFFLFTFKQITVWIPTTGYAKYISTIVFTDETRSIFYLSGKDSVGFVSSKIYSENVNGLLVVIIGLLCANILIKTYGMKMKV